MLHSFTWQQFLIATLIFTIIWYLALAFLYGRKNIFQLVFSRSKPPEKLKRDWDDELEEDFEDDISTDNDNNLIGAKKEPIGVSEVEMHMLNFSPKKHHSTDEDELTSKPLNTPDQLGLIPDVIEELKGIFHIMKNEQGTKEDFLSLFDLLKEKYPTLTKLSNHNPLIEFIIENVPFDISHDEIIGLFE